MEKLLPDVKGGATQEQEVEGERYYSQKGGTSKKILGTARSLFTL